MLEEDPTLDEDTAVLRVKEITPATERWREWAEKENAGDPRLPGVDGRGEIQLLEPAAILRVTVDGGRVFAETAGGSRYLLKMRLYEAEERLRPFRFVRICSSEIVNAAHITHLDATVSGTMVLTLTGGIRTYVARREIRGIRRIFDL